MIAAIAGHHNTQNSQIIPELSESLLFHKNGEDYVIMDAVVENSSQDYSHSKFLNDLPDFDTIERLHSPVKTKQYFFSLLGKKVAAEDEFFRLHSEIEIIMVSEAYSDILSAAVLASTAHSAESSKWLNDFAEECEILQHRYDLVAINVLPDNEPLCSSSFANFSALTCAKKIKSTPDQIMQYQYSTNGFAESLNPNYKTAFNLHTAIRVFNRDPSKTKSSFRALG